MSLSADSAERVRRAGRRLRAAEAEWREALAAARLEGLSFAEIARAGETSRQRIRQLLGRGAK